VRTRNLDCTGGSCLSSEAGAAFKTFGGERGLPVRVEEITAGGGMLLSSYNPAETMPRMM
jgi:hypothetical protein